MVCRLLAAEAHRLGARGSAAAAPGSVVAPAPQSTGCALAARGLVAAQHVGSSQSRDRARLAHVGRETLYHLAAREART